MTSDEPLIARECVEGYLFSKAPFRLLLLRRPPARGRYWVPVSGKVEPADVSYEAAARREVAEETAASATGPPVDLDWHVVFTADNGETWRLHAYAFEVPASFVPRLSSEHDAYRWVRPEEALQLLHFPDNRQAVHRLAARLAPGETV